MVTSYQAAVVIDAPLSRVWALVSDPGRHREFDDSGMVGPPVDSGPVTRTGQIFTMNMTYRDGEHVEHYQADNHVTVYEPGRVLAWATATQGGAPLGWSWRYDLEAVPDGTRVTLTYDWADASPTNIRRFGVPLTDTGGLERSLRQLDRLAGN